MAENNLIIKIFQTKVGEISDLFSAFALEFPFWLSPELRMCEIH